MSGHRRGRFGWGVGVAVVLCAAGMATAFASSLTVTSQKLTLATVSPACVPAWWNASYGYREQVSVTTGSAAATSDYAVPVTFNHAALVTGGKSLASGDDVRVVALNSTACAWTELDRVVDDGSAWNSATTKVWFKLTAAISASSSSPTAYYLYYGNPAAVSPPANPSNVFLFYDTFPGSSLSGSWTSLRPPTTWSVSGNALNITMNASEDFKGATNTAPLFYITAPSGDLEVRAKQSGALTLGGETSGILAYQNDSNYVSSYHEFFSGGCSCEGAEQVKEVSGTATSQTAAVSANPMYVRITKSGTSYTGSYSTNGGTSFTNIGSASTITLSSLKLGLTGFSSTTNVTSVALTNFRVRRYTSPEPTTALGAETAKY